MYLHRDDIEKIAELIKKFPDCEVFEIREEGESGIGSVTTLTIKTKVNGLDGKFEVVVSDEESW